MNLHENIHRIKEVMGIITESKLDTFQSLLNYSLAGIKNDCQYQDMDAFPNDLSFQSCDEGESVSNIIIIDFKWDKTEYSGRYKKGEPLLILTVDVNLQTVNRYEPNSLLFDLAKRISDWIGTPVHIELNDVKTVGINESVISALKRRAYEIPQILFSEYTWLDPKRFDSFEEFLERCIFGTTRDISSEFGANDYEEQLDIRVKIEPFIRKYIMDNHLEEIRNYYEKG